MDPPGLDDVLALGAPPIVRLGGGDATSWPPLDAFLAANRMRERPSQVWIEAPASSLDAGTLERLVRGGVHGVVVLAEALGVRMAARLRVGEPVAVVETARTLGLEVEVLATVRPSTFAIVAPLAARVHPVQVWLEIVPWEPERPPGPIPATALRALLDRAPNLSFSGWRQPHRGYLPPCVLPDVWRTRPDAWEGTLRARDTPNGALEACRTCGLRSRCHFGDPSAIEPQGRAAATPLPDEAPVRAVRRSMPVPPEILAKRRPPEVVCTTPWTTMEVTDAAGDVQQCCNDWTEGSRGSLRTASLLEIWNGPGYQDARRRMGSGEVAGLCRSVCPRLRDRAWSERGWHLLEGTAAFTRNQLLVAADVAERRVVAQGRPTRLILAPSSVCNYDCIMCDHGRTPRRDLPSTIWAEVDELVPTLESLTLLGGEPLVNQDVVRLLRGFDVARTPDLSVSLVTNGSLLTEKMLSLFGRCVFGQITVSVNAGTAAVYERVQRGIPLDALVANLEALLRFRAGHVRPFRVLLSFVVQPAASHTLIPFGELARRLGVGIRLLPFVEPPHAEPSLACFYADEDAVARVAGDLDRFVAWARPLEPAWARHAQAVRGGILAESRRACAGGGPARSADPAAG